MTAFSLGAESRGGRFERQQSRFREWVSADGSSGRRAEPGRFHLYVALACPWSHRVVIARQLEGLQDAVSISFLHPYRDARGWAFSGDGYDDPLHGWSFLSEAYLATDPGFAGRVTVPVLWDKETGTIVSNESTDIVAMLDSEWDEWARTPVSLVPDDAREEIAALDEWIYPDVNNGVYRTGFASSQDAYDEAFDSVFAALDRLEERLGESRYLVGDRLTAADWKLFVTLVRFDTVYYLHFRCNLRRITDYPALWGYLRDLYQQPGIADTVAMDEIKRHYYTTHDMLNPKRIIPRGPDLDWWAPHGRDG